MWNFALEFSKMNHRSIYFSKHGKPYVKIYWNKNNNNVFKIIFKMNSHVGWTNWVSNNGFRKIW